MFTDRFLNSRSLFLKKMQTLISFVIFSQAMWISLVLT